MSQNFTLSEATYINVGSGVVAGGPGARTPSDARMGAPKVPIVSRV